MRLAAIVAAFDATVLDPATGSVWVDCLRCGAATCGYRDGRACLCEACTYRELGESAYDLRLRSEFRLSKRAYQAKLEKYGPPYVSAREWLTPRSRRK